ncbi:MAG: retroviral-like aspartic protease [Planctomycetes bacterium]|nr:retroviral-like aspartic protease [Planctomycetota bacterium]
MGDIIQEFQVRTATRRRGVSLRLLFDSGSPRTFVKRRIATKLGNLFRLPEQIRFGGLGNGRFAAGHVVHLQILFLDLWCPHPSYVVPDSVLEDEYDILVGHDLIQIYDVRLDPKHRQVLLRRSRLEMGLRVRHGRRVNSPPA